ncbi:unnamed protein product [Pipistrellus nathusii]|uniref:Uncharacterized protein n=1 Tax=Pipistrellus nathusii TaxID=59473 RepID=A0ABN9Z7M0_PIPNA
MYQRILRGGDFSDFTWLHRPTCVDSEQKPLNPELEKRIVIYYGTTICLPKYTVLYLFIESQSYSFYIRGLAQDYPFCCCSDCSLPSPPLSRAVTFHFSVSQMFMASSSGTTE